jgi:putative tricarboxylic transport membrane protein
VSTSGALSQRQLNAGIGVAVILAGVGFAVLSWRLPAGPDPSAPGPGAAPGILGVLLALCGLWVMATALMSSRQTAASASAGASDDGSARKVQAAIVLLFAGALLLEPLGFMLSTFLFLVFGFRILGGATWQASIPTAAAVSGGFWLFFTKLLGVGLPFGRIVEILFY